MKKLDTVKHLKDRLAASNIGDEYIDVDYDEPETSYERRNRLAKQKREEKIEREKEAARERRRKRKELERKKLEKKNKSKSSDDASDEGDDVSDAELDTEDFYEEYYASLDADADEESASEDYYDTQGTEDGEPALYGASDIEELVEEPELYSEDTEYASQAPELYADASGEYSEDAEYSDGYADDNTEYIEDSALSPEYSEEPELYSEDTESTEDTEYSEQVEDELPEQWGQHAGEGSGAAEPAAEQYNYDGLEDEMDDFITSAFSASEEPEEEQMPEQLEEEERTVDQVEHSDGSDAWEDDFIASLDAAESDDDGAVSEDDAEQQQDDEDSEKEDSGILGKAAGLFSGRSKSGQKKKGRDKREKKPASSQTEDRAGSTSRKGRFEHSAFDIDEDDNEEVIHQISRQSQPDHKDTMQNLKDALEILDIPESYSIPESHYMPNDLEDIKFSKSIPEGFDMVEVEKFYNNVVRSIGHYVHLLKERNQHVVIMGQEILKLEDTINELRHDREIDQAQGIHVIPTQDDMQLEQQLVDARLEIKSLRSQLAAYDGAESMKLSDEEREKYNELQDDYSKVQRENDVLSSENREMKGRIRLLEEELSPDFSEVFNDASSERKTEGTQDTEDTDQSTQDAEDTQSTEETEGTTVKSEGKPRRLPSLTEDTEDTQGTQDTEDAPAPAPQRRRRLAVFSELEDNRDASSAESLPEL